MLPVALAPILGQVAMFLFIVGVACSILGTLALLMDFHALERFRVLHEKRMRQAQSGIVFVWAMCFFAICIYSIMWFILGWPAMAILDIYEAGYSGIYQVATTIAFIKAVIKWHPFLMIIGLLIWAFVSSQRREDITYPVEQMGF